VVVLGTCGGRPRLGALAVSAKIEPSVGLRMRIAAFLLATMSSGVLTISRGWWLKSRVRSRPSRSLSTEAAISLLKSARMRAVVVW
jgi:hypothetical protein